MVIKLCIVILAIVLIIRYVDKKLYRLRNRGKWYYRLREDISFYISDFFITIEHFFNTREPDPEFIDRFCNNVFGKSATNMPYQNSKFFFSCKTKEELTKKIGSLLRYITPIMEKLET